MNNLYNPGLMATANPRFQQQIQPGGMGGGMGGYSAPGSPSGLMAAPGPQAQSASAPSFPSWNGIPYGGYGHPNDQYNRLWNDLANPANPNSAINRGLLNYADMGWNRGQSWWPGFDRQQAINMARDWGYTGATPSGTQTSTLG